jgi:hypothetical protein
MVYNTNLTAHQAMLKVGKFLGNHSMYAAIIKGGGQVRWDRDDERGRRPKRADVDERAFGAEAVP